MTRSPIDGTTKAANKISGARADMILLQAKNALQVRGGWRSSKRSGNSHLADGVFDIC